MKYTQKAKEIDAYTFPVAINVSLPISTPNTNATREIAVPAGDYLLFIDGDISVITKKEFHNKHDPVSTELAETRYSKPRSTKPKTDKASKRGLKASVLEQKTPISSTVETRDENGRVEQAELT